MGENQPPRINPALIIFAVRLRLLSDSKALDGLESRNAKLPHYFSWASGSLFHLTFGWLTANMIAIHGWKYTRSLDVEHSDWALQTYDLAVNFLVLATIFFAQISWFISARLMDDEFKRDISRGKLFFVPHALVVLGFVLISIRLNQLPPVEYPYYLPDPFVFCLVWTFWATVFCLGLTGFWRYMLIELYRDIKKKLWD
jgi:hypothetical protein